MELFLFCWALAWLIQRAVVDTTYAFRGKVSPRMQVKLAQARQHPSSDATYGLGPYFRDLWSDALSDATDRRRRKKDAKAAAATRADHDPHLPATEAQPASPTDRWGAPVMPAPGAHAPLPPATPTQPVGQWTAPVMPAPGRASDPVDPASGQVDTSVADRRRAIHYRSVAAQETDSQKEDLYLRTAADAERCLVYAENPQLVADRDRAHREGDTELVRTLNVEIDRLIDEERQRNIAQVQKDLNIERDVATEVPIPADARKPCSRCGKPMQLLDDLHIDEGDGTAMVGLRCDQCRIESYHSWVVPDGDYRSVFGHPFGEDADIAECPWIPPGTHQACGKPPLYQDSPYCAPHYVIGRYTECAWGDGNPDVPPCPGERIQHQPFCETHMAEFERRTGDPNTDPTTFGGPETSASPAFPEPLATVTPITKFGNREDSTMTTPNPAQSPDPAQSGETVSLASAMTYTESMAQAAKAGASSVEQSMAHLNNGKVSGEALAHLTTAGEALASAEAAFASAGVALSAQLTVKEAYEATPGAGDKEFVTGE